MALVNQKIERLPRSLVDKFSAVSTPHISDFLDKTSAMISDIRPVYAEAHITGSALTVKSIGGGVLPVAKAITTAMPGDVLVIDAHGNKNLAVMGELMTTDAMSRGIVGAVVDGCVRDVEAIKRLNFPVFARGVVPNVGTTKFTGEINGNIQCGGVEVKPGDVIVGDENGVVVVPREKAEAALTYGTKKMVYEEKLIEESKKTGKLIHEMLGYTTKLWDECWEKENAAKKRILAYDTS